MIRIRTFAFLLLGLLVALPLHAQPKSLGARIAGLTAPLGADSAMAIIRIDTAKVDFPAAIDWVAKAMKATPEDRAQMEKGVQQPREFVQSFRAAGGQELLWLIFPASGAGRDPIEVAGVVTTAAAKGPAVAEFLRKSIPEGPFEITSRGDNVIIATAERMKSLAATAKPSATIAKAFDAAGEGTVQAVLQLPDDMRRVVSETLPRLPDEFGGVGGKELSEAFSWAAIAIDAPPKFKLKLQVQATSADGAQTLAKVAGNWFKIAGSPQEIRQAIPGFDELMPLLTPKSEGDKVVLSLGERPGEIERLIPAIAAPLQAARGAAARLQSMNNLKPLALSMHKYLDVYTHFPAQASLSKAGKPLLSWRVHVLPFLEGNELYKQFHLDEPWDSEHNKKLIEKMPKVFEDPRVGVLEKGKTVYVVPVGEKTIFGGKEGMKIQKITDGTSNTILAVESDAKHAVIWTKPDDLQIDPKDATQGLFSDDRKQVVLLFADGSVRTLAIPKAADKLPALFSATGGEVVVE